MSYEVIDRAALRAKYDLPRERVAKKVLPRLGQHMREFIALSPFCVVATAGEGGRLDASPRGDAPGFVKVVDETLLELPDRPGNNRIDSSENLVRDPHIGMIFFVPGVDETLRINGQAKIRLDPALCEAHAYDGRAARAVWQIAIEEAFWHCGKALIRSELWNPERRIARSSFPSYAQITQERFGGDLAEYERHFETDYKERLY